MKVLLAVDGSKHAKAAVLKFCEIFGDGSDLKIRIVSVVDDSVSIDGIDRFGAATEYYSRLEDIKKEFAEKSVEEAETLIKAKLGDDVYVDTDVVIGSPKARIVEDAEEWDADLIIVGSHGYGFFERLLVGSVSDAVLHHAHCSVLVVKIKDSDNLEIN